MDISTSRRHLSLGILAICCIPLVGCTEVAYARIRISSTGSKNISHSEIDSWLVEKRWRKSEQGYVLDGETGVYLSLGESEPKLHVLVFRVVGVDKLEPAELAIYKELVLAFTDKFGAAVEYDKVTNKGQSLL